jgi:hypothetical protein
MVGAHLIERTRYLRMLARGSAVAGDGAAESPESASTQRGLLCCSIALLVAPLRSHPSLCYSLATHRSVFGLPPGQG